MTILGTIRNYRAYRRAGLRNAWSLSGMNGLVGDVIRAVLIAIWVAIFIWAWKRDAMASVERVYVQKVAEQASEIDELRKLLAACVSTRIRR